MLKTEIRRAFSSRNLLVSFIAAGVLYFFSFSSIEWINIMKYPMGSLVYWMDILYFPSVSARVFMPLVAALPYAASIADDLDSGLLLQTLPRSSLKRFSCSRFIAAGMTGGAVLLAARIGLLLLMLWRLPFAAADFPPYPMTYIDWMIEHQAVWQYFVFQGITQFLLGFCSAGLSLCLSVYTNRRGVIYTFVSFLLIVLSQVAGFSLLDYFSGVSGYFLPPSSPGHALYMIGGIGLAIIVSSYAIFHLSLRRRLYR